MLNSTLAFIYVISINTKNMNSVFLPLQPMTPRLAFTYSSISEFYSLHKTFLVPFISRKETVSTYNDCLKFRTKGGKRASSPPIKLNVFDNTGTLFSCQMQTNETEEAVFFLQRAN